LILILAFVLVARRIGCSWQLTLMVGAAVVAGWLLLFLYNFYYFGHVLGFPEPSPTFNKSAIQYTMGLVFGRDQGVFVQLPTALVGVAGLWLARRRVPVGVLTSVAVVGVILVLNGTYVSNAYGGYTFDGRFEWSIMPLMVAWAGWAISRWQSANRSLWGPTILVAGAWVYQAVPILNGQHSYYNDVNAWDPVSSSGWWPGLNWILPQFDGRRLTFGNSNFALLFEIALFLLVVFLAIRYARPGTMRLLPSIAVFTGLTGAIIILCITAPTELPATSVMPTKTLGDGDGTPGVALRATLPGTYKTTLTYTLTGAIGLGTLAIWCQNVSGSHTATSQSVVRFGSHSANVLIHCSQPGLLAASLKLASGSSLTAHRLILRKTAT
jgi:hypothetical protein